MILFALWIYLHWDLYREYLNIRHLNNLLVLTELFPTPDLLDWRIPHIYIYIYIYIYIIIIIIIHNNNETIQTIALLGSTGILRRNLVIWGDSDSKKRPSANTRNSMIIIIIIVFCYFIHFYSVFGNCTERANCYWYHRHFHVSSFFLFSCIT